MYKLLLITALIYSLLTPAGLVQAEVFKCKDRNGVVNFTSTPCGEKTYGIKRSEKKVVELNPDGTKKTRKQIVEDRLKKEKEFLEATKRQQEDEKQKQEKLDAHNNIVLQNCAKARKDLKNYQRSRYLFTKDEEGKKTILPDAEKEKFEIDARRRITYWCR